MAGWVNTPEPDVVGSARTMQQRLHQDTTAWISDANEALGPDLRAFNALAVKAGLSPITPEESLRQVASASDEENTRAAEDDF